MQAPGPTLEDRTPHPAPHRVRRLRTPGFRCDAGRRRRASSRRRVAAVVVLAHDDGHGRVVDAEHGYAMFSVIEKETGRWVGRVGPWTPADWPGDRGPAGASGARKLGQGLCGRERDCGDGLGGRQPGLDRHYPLHRRGGNTSSAKVAERLGFEAAGHRAVAAALPGSCRAPVGPDQRRMARASQEVINLRPRFPGGELVSTSSEIARILERDFRAANRFPLRLKSLES